MVWPDQYKNKRGQLLFGPKPVNTYLVKYIKYTYRKYTHR